jgi:hypothetical protein
MNIIFQPKIDPDLAPTEIESQSRGVIPDCSEALHQLIPERRHIARHKSPRTIQNATAQRQVLSGSSELLEEGVYWFLTAPALIYVIYLAFGF